MTATLVIMGTIFFAIAVPAAPSAIGTFEFAMMQVLEIFGVSREAGFGFAVIAHAVFFLPPTIMAAVFLSHEALTTAGRRRDIIVDRRTQKQRRPRLNLLHIFKSSLRRNLIVGVMLLMLIGFACSDSSVETVVSTPTPQPTSTIAVPTIPASPFPTATVMAPTESTPTPVTSPRANPPTATAVPEPTTRPVSVTVATPVPSTPALPRPTPDARRRGGTLNLATREVIAHQDVHQDVSPALSTWGPGVAYSRLMRYRSGPDIELPNLAVECDLCESWEMETPTSFVFRLREGIRWQNLEPVNGRVLTSEDIAFSYVRQSQPTFANAPLMRNIDTVQPISDSEFRITLEAQDADFFSALADGHSKIVAREAVEQAGDLRNGPTVGTGPWVLKNSEPRFIHEFARNSQYFEADLPLIENLRFHVLPEQATRSASFLVGVLDAHQIEGSEARDYLQQTPAPTALMVKQPGNGLEFAINTDRPPFDDPRVRLAAFMALDPWKAIEEHWGGFAFVSSGFPVTEPGWLMEEREQRRFLNRPRDAKALLQDAGFTAPIPVTIKLGDFGDEYLATAHSINIELRTVGFAPEVELVNRRTFGDDVWLGGNYQMFVGPSAPISAPNGYLLPVLHSSGVWNTTGHADNELDVLLEAQAVSLDGAERRQLILKIQERTLSQAYRFMPAARTTLWTWNSKVRDFHPNFAGFEYIHWSRVWLDG